MNTYYIIFYKENKAICGTWKRAINEEEACIFAEFTLITAYPNISYTSCKAIKQSI